jgi:hypothetical protein
MVAFWGATSAYAPGLGGEGPDGDVLIWVDDNSTLWTAWSEEFDKSKLPVAAPEQETATGRPALCETANGTFAAWSGTDGSSTINVAAANELVRYDQITFKQKVTLWGRSAPAGVGMAWGNGRLYLVSATSNGGIQLGWSADPMNAAAWSFIDLPEAAIDTPAVSANDAPDVWIAWAGTDGKGTLNVASGFQPGNERSYHKTTLDGSAGTFFENMPPQFRGPDTSPAGPQIEVDSLSLTVAYIGHNHNIYFLSAFAGAFSRFKCTATSDTGPAISGHFDQGGIAWRGEDGGHTVNLAINPFNEMGAVNDNAGG